MQMRVTENDIVEMLRVATTGSQIIETQMNGIKDMVDNIGNLASVVVGRVRGSGSTPTGGDEEGAHAFFKGLNRFLHGLGAEKQLEGQKLLSTVKQLEEAKATMSSNIIIPSLDAKNI